ncbi:MULTISPECIES: Flp pilus assembly protein CpaB [unclassified Leisingera]|uniref:Flp pilus assembly protein CpaB n=1 Tax=unclassified Leisingera TaxID=2614906 RepID=UPI00057CC604|nr:MULTISPECIES: Flp pilus assembly protein CpaB [unclassified Leisingera]KIC36897.1 pilus assembly protein CpaB [Leisingera sp. ANG-M7]OBY24645.1 Flp pilus assembly protein CpaB [Leisingera sp. JC1]
MNISSLLSMISGLALAGGSAYVAKDYIDGQAVTGGPEGPALVEVVVASQDIAFGTALTAQSLTTIAWPAEARPAGTFTSFDALLPDTGKPPRRARRAIAQGELIRASRVSNFGEKVTIVQTLSPDHRAMAIKVSAETAVGGFVTPGDSVDVLLTQGRGADLKTVTILQNARVIGVDQDANQETDKPGVARTVTVEVTPDEGQRLALAQRAGTLSLTLRNQDAAAEEVPLDSISLNDVLRNLQPQPQEPAAEPARRTVLIRRGTEVSETELR